MGLFDFLGGKKASATTTNPTPVNQDDKQKVLPQSYFSPVQYPLPNGNNLPQPNPNVEVPDDTLGELPPLPDWVNQLPSDTKFTADPMDIAAQPNVLPQPEMPLPEMTLPKIESTVPTNIPSPVVPPLDTPANQELPQVQDLMGQQTPTSNSMAPDFADLPVMDESIAQPQIESKPLPAIDESIAKNADNLIPEEDDEIEETQKPFIPDLLESKPISESDNIEPLNDEIDKLPDLPWLQQDTKSQDTIQSSPSSDLLQYVPESKPQSHIQSNIVFGLDNEVKKEVEPSLNDLQPEPVAQIDESIEEPNTTAAIEIEPVQELDKLEEQPLQQEVMPVLLQPKSEDIMTTPLVENTIQAEVTHVGEFKRIRNVGFVCLNANLLNNAVSESVRKLAQNLSDSGIKLIIDSIKGYGVSIVEAAKKAQRHNVSGIYFKPFYSSYTDFAEISPDLQNYTPIIYSNFQEKIKALIKESDIFIVPETSNVANLTELFAFWSAGHFYLGQNKRIILLGQNWEERIRTMGEIFKFNTQELQAVSFAKDYAEAWELVLDADSKYSDPSNFKVMKTVDLRSESAEVENFIAQG